MSHPFSLHRIHVHVVKFFDELGLTPHVKIVEAWLPEARQRADRLPERKCKLLREYLFARLAAESSRDALLQDLQNEGRAALYRFADKQVNVIGHDDVAGQDETVAVPHLAENLYK